MANGLILHDGIIEWFDGPEWDVVVEDIFEKAADDVKGAAQSNAPWADNTGDAREGLNTSVFEESGAVFLALYHTVEYGIWLETIQNGAFATIMPTLEQAAPPIIREATAAVREARRGKNF